MSSHKGPVKGAGCVKSSRSLLLGPWRSSTCKLHLGLEGVRGTEFNARGLENNLTFRTNVLVLKFENYTSTHVPVPVSDKFFPSQIDKIGFQAELNFVLLTILYFKSDCI